MPHVDPRMMRKQQESQRLDTDVAFLPTAEQFGWRSRNVARAGGARKRRRAPGRKAVRVQSRASWVRRAPAADARSPALNEVLLIT